MLTETHTTEDTMNTITLEIMPAAKGHYLASAIVAGVKKPSHEMLLGANGELRTVGGNPARYFAPDDILWWLAFAIEGKEIITITGALKSK